MVRLRTTRKWNLRRPPDRREGFYRGIVPRRSDLDGPPASYVRGPFREGTVDGPSPVRYAQELARNLEAGMGERSIRELGRLTGISHTTIAGVLNGTRWADLVTIAKLEEALDVRLWPDFED